LIFSYCCEISRPETCQPIPHATCKVYFDIKKGAQANDYAVSFHFETESLIHRWSEMTIREDTFEVQALGNFIELD
jgi:hypothetical protein